MRFRTVTVRVCRRVSALLCWFVRLQRVLRSANGSEQSEPALVPLILHAGRISRPVEHSKDRWGEAYAPLIITFNHFD